MACCIVDAAKMRELQAQDDMLSVARAVAMKPKTNGEYYLKEGFHVQEWTPRGRGEEAEIKHLIWASC